jgi:DNA-binding response OmpR family regulator
MNQPSRIILGERDSPRRRLIATLLRDEGYEVVETDDGRTLLGYTEYFAATCGRRAAHGAIVADSFAILAGEGLDHLTAFEVENALRRAHWQVPVIRLPEPAPDASEVGAVRQLVHDALPRLPTGH